MENNLTKKERRELKRAGKESELGKARQKSLLKKVVGLLRMHVKNLSQKPVKVYALVSLTCHQIHWAVFEKKHKEKSNIVNV